MIIRSMDGNLKDRRLAASEKDPGLLRERESPNGQAEIASILADTIRLYTAGESSSVKEDTAYRILGSIYYAVRARTASCKTPRALSRALEEYGVHGIYREGIKLIHVCFEETKKLFDTISENKLAVPLGPYNEMIDTAIPEFFRTYNIEFNAQDTACSMDYPLAFDDIISTGIFYLNQYLKNLRTETEFCRFFDRREILKTLYGYHVKFDFDMTDNPLNLFSVLFDQAVFAALSGNEAAGLTVTPEQALRMANALSGMGGSEIKERVNGAVNQTADLFRIENPCLLAYMRRYQTQLTERVINANKYGNLLNLVLISGEDPNAGQDLFLEGESMENTQFRSFAELVGQCEGIEEKIDLISGSIHSSKDFIDLLEADCFYGDEFRVLYGSLGNTELAILGKSVFADELRQDRLRFSHALLKRYQADADRDWQYAYLDFLDLLPNERKTAVEKLINGLTVSGAGGGI